MLFITHRAAAIHRLTSQIDPGFLKRVGWMGVAEMTSRVSRLVTVLALAHWLSIEEFGVCAVAATLLEVVRVATQGGFGTRIVNCVDADLPVYNSAVNRLNLAFNVLAACLFGVMAWPLEKLLALPGLAGLMLALLPSFFIYPWVAVRVFNAHRQQQMRAVSIITGIAIGVDNLLTAFGLYLGLGIYSVAVAKACAGLLWLTCWLVAAPRPVGRPCRREIYAELLSFSRKVISTELLKALRSQVDVLIAALTLSPGHLGIYTFAKNAGVGLSQSLMNAYAVVVVPWLAQSSRQGVCLHRSARQLAMMSGGLASIFLVQAAGAFVYIPLLFDAQWHEATALVAVLCLSALPRTLTDTFALWFRAHGEVGRELLLTMVCTLVPSLILVIVGASQAIENSFSLACLTSAAAACSLVGLAVCKPNPEERRIL